MVVTNRTNSKSTGEKTGELSLQFLIFIKRTVKEMLVGFESHNIML